MSAHPIETYLAQLDEIRRTGGGTAEESYYGALETLLNEIGVGLKPRVRAVAQLQNTGAGEPDFGLFTASQFQREQDGHPLPGALPERGVVEVKGFADDAVLTAAGEQVAKYVTRYGLVLVTNYREFALVGRDQTGRPAQLETCRLADSEAAFLTRLAHPRQTAAEQGDRLLEFLGRALLYRAALVGPEDLAWFLASYAREARFRVEAAAGLPALAGLKQALETALGLTFEGEKGEHFFRATLVQTLFYGVFSSWVLWSRDQGGQPDARFDWRNAAWTLHVPMVAGLFEQIATPTRLKPLGVDEVLDWAGAALDRVDRAAFFAKFEEDRAVQYFYEPFLQAYDPELRRDLGVWYTPPEIVQYQVERVDRALREELDLADGLADENVVVLDPCCGTGAYLVEALKRIHRTLEEKGASALTAPKLKQAAIERVFGFELLPAPLVIAHLQIGMMLRRLGAPLDPDRDQRAGVYLTNALTGWDPPQQPKDELPLFPELMKERDAANSIKRDAPILVILGNPPYNAFAGVSPKEEGGLVEPYKQGLSAPLEQGGWGIRKYNLDDLYVRFFRIAERRIAKSGKGIVSFISNFSYLGDPSFAVMRQRLLSEFDLLWFDCLNGDSRETGKRTPEGKPDPSVFSTPDHPIGIRVGTAICLLVRKEERRKKGATRFQHYWGKTKRQDLLASLRLKNLNRKYRVAQPARENRFSFLPLTIDKKYLAWPRVNDLCALAPTNGLMEKRGGALIDLDPKALEKRMRAYFNPALDWEGVKDKIGSLARKAAAYDPKAVRERALEEEVFSPARLVKYLVRAFDSRWCYHSSVSKLWNSHRPYYWKQCWPGNRFFMSRFRSTASPEGPPFYLVSGLSDDHFIVPDNACFPIMLMNGERLSSRQRATLLDIMDESTPPGEIVANLSDRAREYLTALRLPDPDRDPDTAALVWMHALAVGYSPAYLAENADGVRQDWPRVPLPADKQRLLASAELGRRVAALLDPDLPVEGVTVGKIRPELKSIGAIAKLGGGPLDPDAGQLDLTAGWGRPGRDGTCMPGKGKLRERRRNDPGPGRLLGEKTFDVFLNDVAYWSDVPAPVWDYCVGGYQVVKKWLSYREQTVLGRGLTLEEADALTQIVRRLAALLLLGPELDANYRAAAAETWPWSAEAEDGTGEE